MASKVNIAIRKQKAIDSISESLNRLSGMPLQIGKKPQDKALAEAVLLEAVASSMSSIPDSKPQSVAKRVRTNRVSTAN